MNTTLRRYRYRLLATVPKCCGTCIYCEQKWPEAKCCKTIAMRRPDVLLNGVCVKWIADERMVGPVTGEDQP